MSDSKYTGCISIIDQDGNIAFERDLGSDEVIAELLTRINFFQKPPENGEGIVVGPHNLTQVLKAAKQTLTIKTPKIDLGDRSKNPDDVKTEVIALINKGYKAREVSERSGVSIEYVYTIKSKAKKSGLLIEKPVDHAQDLQSYVVSGSDPDKKEVVLEALRGGATIEEAAKEAQMRPKVVKMIKYMAEKKGEVFPEAA